MPQAAAARWRKAGRPAFVSALRHSAEAPGAVLMLGPRPTPQVADSLVPNSGCGRLAAAVEVDEGDDGEYD